MVSKNIMRSCGGRDSSRFRCPRKGTIYSYTITQEVVMNSPAFEEEIPYALAIVELEECVRKVSQVVGYTPDQVEDQNASRSFFERIDEFSVLNFRLRS